MSNKRQQYEFIVNTSSTCFLCYHDIQIDINGHSKPLSSSSSSLRNLCRYLRINLSETISVPEKLLPILNKLDVQVSLCDGCKVVSEGVSKCCRELEGLRIKLSFYLEAIHGRMAAAGKRLELVKMYQKKLEVEPQARLHSGMVDKLRKEVMQKCHSRIKSSQPRVKIQRISKRQLRIRQARLLPLQSGPENEVTRTGTLSSVDDVIPIELPDLTLANLTQLYPAPEMSTPLGGRLKYPKLRELLNNSSPDIQYLPSSSSSPLSNKVSQPGTKSQTIRCSTCHMDTFHNLQDLRRHKQQHHQQRIPCQFCRKSFCNNVIKNRHIRMGYCTAKKQQRPQQEANWMECKPNMGRGSRYGCKKCSSSFSSRKGLRVHFSKMHEIRIMESFHGFTCDMCLKSFSTQRSLQNHRRDVHPHGSIQIPSPEEDIHPINTGDTHERTEVTAFNSISPTIDIGDVKPVRHNIVNLEREIDPSTDDFQPPLPNSELSPAPSKLNVSVHSCEICNYQFTTVTEKLRHVILCRRRQNTPSGELYFCKYCGSKFDTSIGLGTHVSRMHLFKPRRFKCDLCPKTFIKNNNLKEHRMSKHFGSQFSCEYCSKSCSLASSLYAHQRLHCEEARRRREKLTSENSALASAQQVSSDLTLPTLVADRGTDCANRFNINDNDNTNATKLTVTCSEEYGVVSMRENGFVNIAGILDETNNGNEGDHTNLGEIMPNLNSPEFQVEQLGADFLSPDPLNELND